MASYHYDVDEARRLVAVAWICGSLVKYPVIPAVAAWFKLRQNVPVGLLKRKIDVAPAGPPP